MPHVHPRTESQHTENIRSENERSERSRSEKSTRPGTMDTPLGEMGVRSINAGLHMHKQMLDVFEDIGRDWFASTRSKAELTFQLPTKLTGASSVPDALSAYQEWLGEWIDMFGEDSRRLMSDSQKLIDAGVRCFADTSPLGAS